MKKLLSLVLTLAMLCTICAAFVVTASAEGAPSGDFVTFSSQDSFTITAKKMWDGILYYSTNGEEASWTEYAGGTDLTAAQIGDTGDYYLCFRGERNTKISNNSAWVITGSSVACSGSIENLRDCTGTVTMASSCYAFMFSYCTALVTAPSLPVETLANRCYNGMFYCCTSLVTAPSLPVETLADSCYSEMFFGCTSLVTAPSLPAETLADYCYSYMFKGCTSLATAPSLPAETLAYCCYVNMFSGCTSLVTAPSLPAETLTQNCYHYMFSDCTSLATAPSLPATTLADGCYAGMFRGCTSLATAPSLPATTLADNCYSEMFLGCISLATVPSLPATILVYRCYSEMFLGCIALVTVPELPAEDLAGSCYNRMFWGCTGIKLYENANDAGNIPLAWSIPATANADGLIDWNTDMFSYTGGDFKGAPEIGKAYYYSMNPESRNVTGSYQVGIAATVYSVDITWGSMEFTYTDASQGTWNPETLQYENTVAASWTCEADANKITVTNRSNTEVNAGLSFTGSVDGISCGFYDTATGGNAITGNSFALASAAPVGEATTGTEQTGTAYIHIISGILTSDQTDVKIGTITVEVN